MSTATIHPPQAAIRAHVLEPLSLVCSASAGAYDAAPDGAPSSAANPFWTEGYQQGLEEGRRQAEQPLATLAEALGGAAGQLEAARENFAERAERELLDLSLAIARQVVMGEMRTRPEVIGQIVSQLLDAVGRDKKVFCARLHPLDAERLKSLPAVMEKLQQAGVAVEACAEIATPGGAVLETSFGRLDARLETRLDEIAASLLGVSSPEADEDRVESAQGAEVTA